MDRTTFAGLTELVPGDALESDGGSFLWRNPTVTDHFLEIGAVTHRHDAHPGLADPTIAPTLGSAATGGSLGNDLTLHVGYTIVDADGGETLISPVASITTGGSLDDAGTAPTVTADNSAGALPVGSYYYAVTMIDGSGGETMLSDYAAATRAPGFASGQMLVSGLTALRTAAGASSWRLYRSFNGGGWAFLTAGATDTFTDDGSVCADPTLTPPDIDSTGGANVVTVSVPGLPSGATVNVYASEVDDFTSPSLAATFARSGSASGMVIRSTAFGTGAPPPVSTSKPGASRIDALTDIVNLGSAMAAAGSALVATLAINSGWIAAGSGFQAPRAFKDPTGMVTVEGVVGKPLTSPVVGEVLVTFPAGWEPGARDLEVTAVADVPGQAVVLEVSSAGITLGDFLGAGGSAVSISTQFFAG